MARPHLRAADTSCTVFNVYYSPTLRTVIIGLSFALFPIGMVTAATPPDPGTRLFVDRDDGPARLAVHGAAPEPERPKEGISVGVRGRYISVPDALLDVYLLDHTTLHSYAVGIEVGIDGPAGSRVIFGLDYSDLNMPGGNFRQVGEAPSEASYTKVNLHLITLEALFIWKYPIVEQFGLTYGAGLGVSYTPGDITSTDVLPTCEEPVSECSHWNSVTSRKQPIPSRFWPMVTLLGGFYVDPYPGIRIRFEGGFRGVVFGGISVRSTF